MWVFFDRLENGVFADDFSFSKDDVFMVGVIMIFQVSVREQLQLNLS